MSPFISAACAGTAATAIPATITIQSIIESQVFLFLPYTNSAAMPQTARTVRITQKPACILSPVAAEFPAVVTLLAENNTPPGVIQLSPSCKRVSKAALSLANLTPSGAFICVKINTSLPVWLSTCTLAFTDSPALYESLSVISCAVKPSLVTELLFAAMTFRLRAKSITTVKKTVSNRNDFVFIILSTFLKNGILS